MQRRSAVGLFCEDIRAEKSGAFTLIGIMPDNANLPELPTEGKQGMLAKLCVYVRANFDTEDQPKSVSMSIRLPDGQILSMGGVGESVIQRAFDGSKKSKSPLATILLRAEMHPFPIVSLGLITVDLDIDGERSTVAQLNLTYGRKDESGLEETSTTKHTVSFKPFSSSEQSQPS